jgi:hypothetical protein
MHSPPQADFTRDADEGDVIGDPDWVLFERDVVSIEIIMIMVGIAVMHVPELRASGMIGKRVAAFFRIGGIRPPNVLLQSCRVEARSRSRPAGRQ